MPGGNDSDPFGGNDIVAGPCGPVFFSPEVNPETEDVGGAAGLGTESGTQLVAGQLYVSCRHVAVGIPLSEQGYAPLVQGGYFLDSEQLAETDNLVVPGRFRFREIQMGVFSGLDEAAWSIAYRIEGS